MDKALSKIPPHNGEKAYNGCTAKEELVQPIQGQVLLVRDICWPGRWPGCWVCRSATQGAHMINPPSTFKYNSTGSSQQGTKPPTEKLLLSNQWVSLKLCSAAQRKLGVQEELCCKYHSDNWRLKTPQQVWYILETPEHQWSSAKSLITCFKYAGTWSHPHTYKQVLNRCVCNPQSFVYDDSAAMFPLHHRHKLLSEQRRAPCQETTRKLQGCGAGVCNAQIEVLAV